MDSDSIFPDWMHAAAYGDDLFAAAYASVSAPQRAILKTAIARLWAWYGPSNRARTTTNTLWQQGFSSTITKRPKTRCCVVFDENVGPAALLAAVMPALALGVPGVAVVYLGPGEPSHAVLAALELAGQELVLPGERLEEILELCTAPGGCVVTLGSVHVEPGHRGPAWSGPRQRTIALLDDGKGIDVKALRFAHCEAEIRLEQGRELSAPCQGVFALPEALREVQALACVALGPGHEGCWVYPGLSPEFFMTTAIAWT